MRIPINSAMFNQMEEQIRFCAGEYDLEVKISLLNEEQGEILVIREDDGEAIVEATFEVHRMTKDFEEMTTLCRLIIGDHKMWVENIPSAIVAILYAGDF